MSHPDVILGFAESFSLDRALATKEIVLTHSMLQWKSELEMFCNFVLSNKIKSFLEIGAASGQLSVLLKDVLDCDRVFACDIKRSPLLDRRPDILFFHGNHASRPYLTWRESMGAIDMVFIDADHCSGFRKDYAIELHFPHRFIAFHDIANKAFPSLQRFWVEEVLGNKITFINSDSRGKFGVPEITYPMNFAASWIEYEKRFGRSCGIGVSWRS